MTIMRQPNDKRWWTGNYCELQLTLEQARDGSHQGDCEDDCRALAGEPEIASQLAALNFDSVVRELKEYGAWTEDESRADPDMTLIRLLWIACGDVAERPEDYE